MIEEINKKIKELESNLNIDQQNLNNAANAVEQLKANVIAKKGALQCLRDLQKGDQKEKASKKVEEKPKATKTKTSYSYNSYMGECILGSCVHF